MKIILTQSHQQLVDFCCRVCAWQPNLLQVDPTQTFQHQLPPVFTPLRCCSQTQFSPRSSLTFCLSLFDISHHRRHHHHHHHDDDDPHDSVAHRGCLSHSRSLTSCTAAPHLNQVDLLLLLWPPESESFDAAHHHHHRSPANRFAFVFLSITSLRLRNTCVRSCVCVCVPLLLMLLSSSSLLSSVDFADNQYNMNTRRSYLLRAVGVCVFYSSSSLVTCTAPDKKLLKPCLRSSRLCKLNTA